MKKRYFIIYGVLWIILLAMFWIFHIDEMFYSIISFYVGLPLCLLLIGLFGVDKMNIKTHILFIILALTYMLEEYLTYSMANMIEFSKINPPEIAMFIRALALLYIGYTIRNLFSKE